MPFDSADQNRRLTKALNSGAPPPEQEQLPCPRCDSINTKFCYYNNYNFSQPRHFCKSCRRYWTHGGTLRDIPVGGGTRKNAKRCRTATSQYAAAVGGACHNSFTLSASPVLLPVSGNQGGFGVGGESKLNVGGNFSSLLNTQAHAGFLALGGGFGFGVGQVLDDNGFGIGRGMWSCTELGDGGADVGGRVTGMGNTWQFESGEAGFVGGDCFSWPDLAISTPGNGLK